MSDQLELDLIFPPLSTDLSDVVVHVWIEDIEQVDAPAPAFLEQKFTNTNVSRHVRTVRLKIDLPDLRDAMRPAVRIHVDTSGTGTMTSGDYINPAVVDVPDDTDAPCRVELMQIR
jgi:putative lipoprotein